MKKLSKEDRLFVFFKYGGNCAYCGCAIKEKSFHVDHIKPLKRHIKEPKKHLNTIDNYNPSCPSCNSSKCDWSIEDWRIQISNKYNSLYNKSSAFRFLIKYNVVASTNSPVKFYFESIEGMWKEDNNVQ